jgi:hypothetical protein
LTQEFSNLLVLALRSTIDLIGAIALDKAQRIEISEHPMKMKIVNKAKVEWPYKWLMFKFLQFIILLPPFPRRSSNQHFIG